MNLIVRKASVRWKGGSRTVTTGSGVLKKVKFSWGFPLNNGSHTDSAELIAAAHASSFSSALSEELGSKAIGAGEIVTTATVSLERLAAVWTIRDIHLDVVARLRKVTQGEFIDASVSAKLNCLVSRLLRAHISMNAKLVN
jgi:osmotically inducible protein OsmC